MVPVYLTWRSWLEFLDSFGRVSPRNSADLFVGLSPSLTSQIRQALKFLGLLAPGDQVHPTLRHLIESPELRPAAMFSIIKRSYECAFSEDTIVLAKLEDCFRSSEISLATRRKATAFARHAAQFSGIAIRSEDAEPAVRVLPDQPPHYRKVWLRSGGFLEFSGSFNYFTASAPDRTIVDKILKELDDYIELDEKAAERKKFRVLNDEKEVPF
jgi:hypothetical protein